jgi:hypothetical protein
MTTLATRISEQPASLRGLQSRLSDIQKYLAYIAAGSMSVNPRRSGFVAGFERGGGEKELCE